MPRKILSADFCLYLLYPFTPHLSIFLCVMSALGAKFMPFGVQFQKNFDFFQNYYKKYGNFSKSML